VLDKVLSRKQRDERMAIYSIDTAPLHILIHAGAGLSTVVLGGMVLARRKGTTTHRVLGWSWFALMFLIAIGSFWIRSDGDFSWIHGLSTGMIVTLSYALWAIKSGRVKGHRIAVTCAYIGLCVTAAFTVLPYRLMGQLVF
jgi:uncharacterized membrane protein